MNMFAHDDQRKRFAPRLAIAATMALGLTGLAVASPASSQVSGENGRIAFTSSLVGDDQVASAKPDGSDFSQLTLRGDSVDPDWSPNGKKLTYSEEGSLMIMNANGTGVTTLIAAENDLNYLQPSWSPDGNWIAYIRADYGQKVANQPEINYTSLWKLPADGSGPAQRLYLPARDQIESPAWYPDGSAIGALLRNPNGATDDLYRMGVDGSNPQLIFTSGLIDETSFDWSPDGQRLIVSGWDFSQGNPIRKVWQLAGNGVGPMTPVWADAWDAAWSPDGTRVVAAAEDPNAQQSQLIIFDPNDPGPTRELTGLLGDEPTWQPLQSNDPNNPSLVETTLAVDAKTTDKKLKAGKRYKLVREALTNGSITKTKVVCKVRGKKVKGSQKKTVCKPKVKTPQPDTAKIKAKPTCNSKVSIRVIVQAKYQDADPAKFKRTYKVKGKSGPSCSK